MDLNRNFWIVFCSLTVFVFMTSLNIHQINETISMSAFMTFYNTNTWSEYLKAFDYDSHENEIFNISKFYNIIFGHEEDSDSYLEKLDRRLKFALDKAAREKKVIIWWEPRKESKRKKRREKDLPWICGSCRISGNTRKLNHANVAGVIILYRNALPYDMPPASLRRKDQLYVWYTGESPYSLLVRRNMSFKFEDEFKFNLTMSYRSDADVYQTYGGDDRYGTNNLSIILPLKTHSSITFVSNCGPAAAAIYRDNYLHKLQKIFSLDGYGACFPSQNVTIPLFSRHILLDMIQKHKFYFAFENSYHCRDYTTEKIINGYAGNAVPIVWGAEKKEYEARFPKKSFIHVEDFKTVEELVKYLNYLNKNDTAYMEYHRWRTIPEENPNYLIQSRKKRYCQLCRIANGINVDDIYNPRYDPSNPPRPLFTSSIAHRTAPPLKQWLEDDNKECFWKTLDPPL